MVWEKTRPESRLLYDSRDNLRNIKTRLEAIGTEGAHIGYVRSNKTWQIKGRSIVKILLSFLTVSDGDSIIYGFEEGQDCFRRQLSLVIGVLILN